MQRVLFLGRKVMGNLVKLCRAGDRALQLLLFNEEFLVSVSHQLALITSLRGSGGGMAKYGVGKYLVHTQATVQDLLPIELLPETEGCKELLGKPVNRDKYEKEEPPS